MLLRAVLDGTIEQMLANRFDPQQPPTLLDDAAAATDEQAAEKQDGQSTSADQHPDINESTTHEDIDQVVGQKVQLKDDDLETDTKNKAAGDKGERVN